MRLTFVAILFIAGLGLLYANDPAPYPNIPDALRDPESARGMARIFPEMQHAEGNNGNNTRAKEATNDTAVIEPEVASGFAVKKAVSSDDFIVVTAHPLASEVARDVLKKGGSAVDAVIAAQMMLNLVEPQSSGIGGGGFLLHYDTETKQVISYDGRETSPAKFDPESFLKTVEVDGAPRKVKQSFKVALQGAVSVGTPGLLAMLDKAHEDHGALEWAELFTPAIERARGGFQITPRLKTLLDYASKMHEGFPFKEGYEAQHYAVGETVTNPAFGATLEAIAREGADIFYHGKIAHTIVGAVENARPAGALSLTDLADYAPLKTQALCRPYRAYTICSAPPPAGGVTLLQIMGMLEQVEMKNYDQQHAQGWHFLAEATKLAYGDRAYVADPSFMEVTSAELLNPEYLAKRMELAISSEAPVTVRHGDVFTLDPPSTTHLSVVDAQGNIASMTSSIEHAFGAGVMVGGFFLNNQLTDFDWQLNEGSTAATTANLAQPSKRPRSSMSPTIVFDAQMRPVLVLGSPGGSRIIPYIAKTLVAVLDWEMPLDEAIALPHIVAGTDGKIAYEPHASQRMIRELEVLGHATYARDLTSGLHAIQLRYEGGKAHHLGAADPRREGAAVGE